MLTDFLDGAACVPRGCRAFYGDRKAWRYAVLPILLMTAVYVLLFRVVMYFAGKFADLLGEWFSDLPSWLSWLSSLVGGLSHILGIVIALLILGTTVCSLYEMFGGIFFDSLIEYYEEKKYGIPPLRQSLLYIAKLSNASLLLAVRSYAVFVLLLLLGLLFPIAGQILVIAFMGRYMGVTYMTGSACNSGISLRELQDAAGHETAAVLGFGITAYLLLSIPFATIILLPGLVLGGNELFNGRIKGHLPRLSRSA